MPQLHTYVEARLGRWSRWYHWGSRPGPRPVVSWYEQMVMAPNVQGRGPQGSSECPVDEHEASETDQAVRALPEDLRGVVFELYLKGGTVEQKARALGVSRPNFYYRLERAYIRLLGLFNDQAAGIALPQPNRPEIPVNNKRLTRLDRKPYISGTLA